MRKPKLHRVDQTSVDQNAKMGNCAICGRARVMYKPIQTRWACWFKENEAKRRWDRAHRQKPVDVEKHRAEVRAYSKTLGYAKVMLRYWQRQAERLSATPATKGGSI